ncbi:RRP12-like protein [Cylas formicarius]|uniref:RRP12-like protein n=1 Tax=Cylas formicarius TaxID=197179 RepID=UPI002958956A|nr:RRP12-like protein [Cylas formicarius]
MGKFRSKLKGQAKGKRWPKGQSSSSNPETRKHRDQAKSRFFQENLGPSNLTASSLKKHDASQGHVPLPNEKPDVETDYDMESSAGSFSTFQSMQSFASEWSDCSNMSFGRFMKTFQVNSALHKEMLAILAAITEVIKQNGGSETSTEYFCALLTTLESVYNVDDRNEDQVTAVLSLLNMGVKTVPEPVLRKNFSDTSLKMLHILNDYSSAENNIIIKSTLGILASLLRAQEFAIWTIPSTKQIFNAILNSFCNHSKPKWRKAAHHAVMAVVKANYFVQGGPNPAADQVAEYCEQILDACLGGGTKVPVSSIESGQTTILHTLGLLKETVCSFSKSHIKKCCETILRLMTLNYPLVTSWGLQVFHALFSAPTTVASADLNAKLIQALYDYQPGVTDVQPTMAWLLVMQQAHVHLADIDVAVGCGALPKIFSTVAQLWLSDKQEVTNAATHTLEVLFRDAIAAACESRESAAKHKNRLEKCCDVIHSCLSYQYHAVWNQVLHVIGVMFDVVGPALPDLIRETLKSLAELRDSYKFPYNNELEYAMGAAIRAAGPEKVLDVVPLKKENGDLNIERSWLLPVLKENIKFSTLRYFRENVFPLARYCQQRSAHLAQQNDGIGAHSSELLYLQLWNLLPCFCNRPVDIREEFKNLAKVLGHAISDRKDLRLAVMASLRKLIAGAKEAGDDGDLKELARFDKNYLPILFNVYTTKPIGSEEEGQRLAALETIKTYLTISRPELSKQLFANALERLHASSDEPEDSFIKESILDLIRALVPYQDHDQIAFLYRQCVESLPEIKNNKEQKKAYRILEQICSSDSKGCVRFLASNRGRVQKLLMKCLNTTAVSSKGARLRCLNYLVKAQADPDDKLIRSIVPEAVMCCKDVNEKCRQTAYALLNTIGERFAETDRMQEFTSMLVAGLAGGGQLVTCTVLALASVLHAFSGALGPDNIKLILENVCLLASSPNREIVGSCLSFIKVYCSTLPLLTVGASLECLVKGLTDMTEDCKRHFRVKVRDILDKLVRKYGCDSITPYIPETDAVMHKRLRNLRKLNARRKRLREARKGQDGSDSDRDFSVNAKPKSVDEILADLDSDREDSGDERESRKQTEAWIEEEPETIVDFADPAVSNKISATRPRPPPQEGGKKKDASKAFKTSSDGRLIIKDDSSDDERDGKKSNVEVMDTSQSEDEASIAETLPLSDRKRKRSGSVKSGLSAASHPPMKYKPGGGGIHRPTGSQASAKSVGSEYRSRKGHGDVKRKGKKLDPYAYLPLKRTALNKRKKMKAAGQFKNIVGAAKSGALKGTKAKKNRNNK